MVKRVTFYKKSETGEPEGVLNRKKPNRGMCHSMTKLLALQ